MEYLNNTHVYALKNSGKKKFYDNIDGFYLINPGSTTLPRQGSNKSYCVIYVDKGQLEVEFKEII